VDTPAGGDEVLCERATHDAEPDDADLAFGHSQPPLPLVAGGGRYPPSGAAFKRDLPGARMAVFLARA
jgi:hypothetical protein